MKKILVLTALFLSACTPQVQPHTAGNDAKLSKEIFYANDGTELPQRQWLPKSKPKAIIIALHGFNDYSMAYNEVGPYFAKSGIAFYSYDQRGFGAAPSVGIWGGEENFTGDLKTYVNLIRAKHPHTPIYLLGESMGGAVTIAALSQPDFPHVDGLILVSPAVWGSEAMNPFFHGFLWVFAHTIPSEMFTGNDLKIQATDNIPLLRRMVKDPLIIKKTRVDAVYGLVGLMDNAYDNASKIQTPVLLVYGGRDQVIPPSPVEHTLKHFDHPVQYAFYPQGYHMLMRDLAGEVVMKDIASWIKAPLKPLPSGFGGTTPKADEEGEISCCKVKKSQL